MLDEEVMKGLKSGDVATYREWIKGVGIPTLVLGTLQELMYEKRDSEKEQLEVTEILLEELEKYGEWARLERITAAAVAKFGVNKKLEYYCALSAEKSDHWKTASKTLTSLKERLELGSVDSELREKVEELEKRLDAKFKGRFAYDGDPRDLNRLLPRVARLCDIQGMQLMLRKELRLELIDYIARDKVVWVAQENWESVKKESEFLQLSKEELEKNLPLAYKGWIPTLPVFVWAEARELKKIAGDAMLTTIEPGKNGVKWIQVGDSNDRKIPGALDMRSLEDSVQLAAVYIFGGVVGNKSHWLVEAASTMKKEEECKGC